MQKRAPIVLDLRDRRTDAMCCADDRGGGAHVLSMEVEQVTAALRRLDASCHARVVQSLASDVAKRAMSQPSPSSVYPSGACFTHSGEERTEAAASRPPPPPVSTRHASAARASPATPGPAAASSTPGSVAAPPEASRATAVVAKPEPSAPPPAAPADYDLHELD